MKFFASSWRPRLNPVIAGKENISSIRKTDDILKTARSRCDNLPTLPALTSIGVEFIAVSSRSAEDVTLYLAVNPELSVAISGNNELSPCPKINGGEVHD